MVTAAARIKESPIDIANWNFSSACGRLKLDHDLKSLLAMPYRELELQLPIRMEDGTLRVFRAARILHSNARGPAVGGLRFTPGATTELAFAIANSTTWSAAVVGAPFGGSCGVIDCDPTTLTAYEFETLVRRYASRTHVVLGPYQDIVLASNDAEAALLLDEYSSLHGFTPACVAGKAPEHGGTTQLQKAKPRAAALVLRESATHLARNVQDLRVAIYATRENASDYLAEFASIGCTVVALSDGRHTAQDENGLNPLAIAEIIRHGSPLSTVANSGGAVLSADCDVLVLAGSECAIHAGNAGRVRASFVLEAGPLSVTPSADVAFKQQRAIVVPDLLGASGAIIAAHTEWAANLEQKQLHTRDIEAELECAIPKAVASVFERSAKDHSSLRSAAYCIAVERVARTERLRGI